MAVLLWSPGGVHAFQRAGQSYGFHKTLISELTEAQLAALGEERNSQKRQKRSRYPFSRKRLNHQPENGELERLIEAPHQSTISQRGNSVIPIAKLAPTSSMEDRFHVSSLKLKVLILELAAPLIQEDIPRSPHLEILPYETLRPR